MLVAPVPPPALAAPRPLQLLCKCLRPPCELHLTGHRIETKTEPGGSVVYVTQTSYPSGNSTVDGNNKDKGGGTNVGAIVGGVVGGVCGLALILGIIFFIVRKRKRSYRDDFDDMMVSICALLGVERGLGVCIRRP